MPGKPYEGASAKRIFLGNHGFKDSVPKMFFKLFGNMLGQCCPLVEHDSQQTDYFQITVHIGMNLLDRVDQIGQTFESIIFALHPG